VFGEEEEEEEVWPGAARCGGSTTRRGRDLGVESLSLLARRHRREESRISCPAHEEREAGEQGGGAAAREQKERGTRA